MITKRKIFSPSALCVFLVSTPALAQQPAAAEAALDEKFDEGRNIVGRGGPLDRAGAATSGSALQINVNQGESDLSLAINFDLNRSKPTPVRGVDDAFRLSSLNLVATASAPFSGDKNNSNLFSGDSLVTGSKLKLALTHMSSILRDGRKATPKILQIYTDCVSVESRAWGASHSPDGPGKAAAYRVELSKKNPDATTIRQIIRLDMGADTDDLAKFIKEKCDKGDVQALAASYSADVQQALREAIFVDAPLTFMGIDASLGQNGYKSLDRTAFKINDVSRTSWEVGAYYGLVFPGLRTSLRARMVYGKQFKSPDEIQLCRPAAGSTNQECIKGPDGLPTSQKTGLASFELRHLLSLSDNTKAAIAPQIAYNFAEKDVRLEVPLYLSPDKAGQLTGGIKFSYSTEKDDYVIGLFVGVPFSIFFN